MFDTTLPLDNNLTNNLSYLIERIEKQASPLACLARENIDNYMQKLFSFCTQFSSDAIERVMCDKRDKCDLHFIYRINLMQAWLGELIIEDESRVYMQKIINGPSLVVKLQKLYLKQDTSLEQEYMLIKMLLGFNEYYMENGSVFPAYIKVINREYNIQNREGAAAAAVEKAK